jgi:hypothetical protein
MGKWIKKENGCFRGKKADWGGVVVSPRDKRLQDVVLATAKRGRKNV